MWLGSAAVTSYHDGIYTLCHGDSFGWHARRAVVAPHLVSAACHRDPGIASMAVDCLRHLVGQLLSRAELSNFTYQVGPDPTQYARAHIPVT